MSFSPDVLVYRKKFVGDLCEVAKSIMPYVVVS